MPSQALRAVKVACVLLWCAQFLNAQDLAVNKYQFDGNKVINDLAHVDALAGEQIKDSTTTLGALVMYVVRIINSGANLPVTLTENLPGGFILLASGGITCTPFGGAVCPAPPLNPPTLGPFTIPATADGQIVLVIKGYFKDPLNTGLKTNEAKRKRDPDLVCTDAKPRPADCAFKTLYVTPPPFGLDFSVNKKVDVATVKFGDPVKYSITLKNEGLNASLDDVYIGGIVQLHDQFTNTFPFDVKVTLSNFQCLPSASSVDCPDLDFAPPSFTLSQNQTIDAFTIRHQTSTTPHPNDSGHLPPGQSFTITFNAVFEPTNPCKIEGNMVRNQVFLQYSNNVATFSDLNPNNNASRVDVQLDTSGLPDKCSGGGGTGSGIAISKKQITPAPGSIIPWTTDVVYEITVTNNTSDEVKDVPVFDYLQKTLSTPPFVATLKSGPTCSFELVTGVFNPADGCSFISGPSSSPTTVDDRHSHQLFKGNIASIPGTIPVTNPMKSSVTIRYTVSYDAPCETDAGSDQISNFAQTDKVGGNSVTTNMVELPVCKLSVCKLVGAAANLTDCPLPPPPPPQLIFGTPVVFKVFYQNLSSQPLTVNTVRDVISLTSSRYSDLPAKYSRSCVVTPAGGVTPPVSDVNDVALIGGVKFNNPVWDGIMAIDSALTFGPNSMLTCTVSVTATQPTKFVTCQGAESPRLINSAFMELSGDFFATFTQPLIYDSKTADLPLCRKVLVNKDVQNVLQSDNSDPGRTVRYTITATNKGDDSVAGVTLTDTIDPVFTLVPSVPTCAPAGCTVTAAGVNPVVAKFAPLNPTQTATLTFAVTAPLANGSFNNSVIGSFAPGGTFYFGGDPVQALQPPANVVVLVKNPGFLEICKASTNTNPVTGNFTFTATNGTFSIGPLLVPVGGCAAPIQVPAGTVTITEAPTTGVGLSAITASGFNPATLATENRLVTSDLPSRTATVTVVAGDASTATIATFTNFKVPTGFVEVCKAAAPGATVTGSFTFNIPGAPNNPYTIPVGACSGPIPVQAGSTTITEAPRGGYQLVDVTTLPADRLVSKNLPGGSAIATVVGGDLSTETVVIFFNDSAPGQMKICKIAGTGIVPGQTFTISSNGVPYTVPAGPASQGGFCVLDSTFPVGAVVNVQETIPSGDQVSSITVNPPDRGTGKPDLVKGAAQVTIGSGFTEVTYTNTAVTPPPSGQLTICKIAGQGVDVGTNFTFTATGQGSTQTYTVPAGPASQGGFCVRDGTYPIGSSVTIKEVAPARTGATSITVAPADRGGTPDLTNGSVAVTIGTGSTDVAFTNSASVGIATTALLAGQPGVAFSQTLAATGGTPPYFWQVMDGTLPPGFALNPFTGEITGPPMDDPAPVLVTFKVMDSSWPSQTESASFTEKSSACCSTMRPRWARRP